jgi:hypothetical protein
MLLGRDPLTLLANAVYFGYATIRASAEVFVNGAVSGARES